MEPRTQDQCDRFEQEIQQFPDDGAEAVNIDDDEVEELHNSLREIIQDPSVKPKLQCLMVDPSFSMVTVQSEDSGIVWETASSRCSTPWASEASSPSDAFSLEGSGSQGNVIIIMDEDKIKRRQRTSSRGKLGDRFRRPSPAIGEERPAMIEVSVPNVRNEASEGDEVGEGKPDKDQDFFNLISEGFEILNIVVPSKLPTVDEEESTELADNLSYLQATPKIKSKFKQPECTVTIQEGDVVDIEETKDSKTESNCQTSSDEQAKKDETDMDYLEKFTLLDQHAPGDESKKVETIEVVQPLAPQEETKVEDTVDEDSFVIISDVEIADEHLDEVFYGASCYAEPVLPSHPKDGKECATKESSKPLKECGSTLFDSQETILTPIFLSSGPPKIIDQDLLDEPRAMSFHYSDLYEEAVGDKKRDEDCSDAESVVSEKSFKRRFSDSDDADGYLEKFTLKDDAPGVENSAEVDHTDSDRMIWQHTKFEMTGCLIRVQEENEPQEDGASISKSELSSKDDVLASQIQPPASSEDCSEIKMTCTKVACVSECCEDSEGCGTKTGCVLEKISSHEQIPQKVVEAVEKKIPDKFVLTEDGNQKKGQFTSKNAQVYEGQSQALKPGTKTEFELECTPVPQEKKKTEIAGSVASGLCFQDNLEKIQKMTENKETVITTTEKASSKGLLQKNETQEKVESPLVKDTDLKDTLVLPTTAEKIQIEPEKDVRKELDVDEKECISVGLLQRNMAQEGVESQRLKGKDADGENILPLPTTAEKIQIVPKQEDIRKDLPISEKTDEVNECQVECTAKLQESKTELIESTLVPALLQVGVSVSAVQSIPSENEKRKRAIDKTGIQEVKTEQKAEDIDVKTELVTVSESKTEDACAQNCEEIKSAVTEIVKEETECVKDIVLALECSVPARDQVTAGNTESVHLTIAAESPNYAALNVHISENHILANEQEKVEGTELKSKVPRDCVEKQEIGKNTSIDTLTPSFSTVAEVTETDLLSVEVKSPTLDEDISTEKDKVTDAFINDIQAKAKHTETVSLIHATETENLSIVMPPPEAMELVPKEKVNEIEGIAIDKEFTFNVPEVNEKSEISAQEVEGKSRPKKVHLKDTHTENIWRTLKPLTPSPPVDIHDLTMRVSPIEPTEQRDVDEILDVRIKRGTGLFSPLQSFIPQEDLSGVGCDTTELDLNKEITDEFDYEMVTKQDAKESDTEVILVKEEFQEVVYVQDRSAEEMTEDDYEFIEDLEGAQTSELQQLLEKGEIQPMDAFCLVCCCPILISDGGHEDHRVSTLDEAFKDIKGQLSNWISVLQERSENIEDMVSELEQAYNSVEEHCRDSEKVMDEQNEEMLKLVLDQYNEMSQAMEEEKKAKLEKLYDQIVSFQENIDSAKDTMEKTEKEMEETDLLAFVSSCKDVDKRLKTALDSTMSLELGPRGLLVFEDYAKGTSGNEKKKRQVIPVPQQPHLQAQEPNSATSTSVTVYWTVNEGDIIDCFQVYCMEEPQGAISEEYRVTVKESYCSLEELEPDKCYKVWVMAVNYTGCSLSSERLPFRTAPSVPVIHPETCTVLWDSAILRWSCAQPTAVESFTLEYCRQYALEGEGLRSLSGIKGCNQKVLLQPNENFLFYIKSVNSAGASEQSEAALISTRGTRFHLLNNTASSVLKISENKDSVEYPLEIFNEMSSRIECPAVMGELLPRVGSYYWETVVVGCMAYRIGIAYESGPQDITVGENSASWCLHCVPTSIRFELLHDSVESDVFVVDVPARIGTLLDFSQGRLVFFNAQNGQCLGSFQHVFSQACHPVFVVERPGTLELKMPMEVPEFAKNW